MPTGVRPPPRIERSAGGVVFRRRDGDANVLLIRDPYGKWGLPKGHLEEGEGRREAALREVREETGLETLEAGPEVTTIDWYFRREGELVHKFCTFYAMHSPEGEARPQRDEGISACLWLPVDEAVDRVEYENTRDVVGRAGRMIRDGEEEISLDL